MTTEEETGPTLIEILRLGARDLRGAAGEVPEVASDFRQLLAGRDFARADPIARQMVNFVYLVGDRDTGEATCARRRYRLGSPVIS